jgi:glycerol-3-phosphate dehydrogenase
MDKIDIAIIGGGCYGVGFFHDAATRGIPNVWLFEKNKIASGTSSRSTKLFHGGLRYLENVGQWPLVYSALKERTMFLSLLQKHGLVQPLPFILPNFKDSRPAWLVYSGIKMYDLLAQDASIPPSSYIDKNTLMEKAPYLNPKLVDKHITSAFVYHDAQIQDDVLANAIHQSALHIQPAYQSHEHTDVTHIEKRNGGYVLTYTKPHGATQQVFANMVINASGPWANANLLRWGMVPKTGSVLNVGSHLLFNNEQMDFGASKNTVNTKSTQDAWACLVQLADKRVVFFIPWFKQWLFGTTESILHGNANQFVSKDQTGDKAYLWDIAKQWFTVSANACIDETEFFSGIRCLPVYLSKNQTNVTLSELQKWQKDPWCSPFYSPSLDKNISSMSRELHTDTNSEHFYTLYGGKWTTYRHSTKVLLDKFLLTTKYANTESGTHLLENWPIEQIKRKNPHLFVSNKTLRE